MYIILCLDVGREAALWCLFLHQTVTGVKNGYIVRQLVVAGSTVRRWLLGAELWQFWGQESVVILRQDGGPRAKVSAKACLPCICPSQSHL